MNKKVKVLQINTYFRKGSTGRIVEDLYRLQLEQGYDPYVIYGNGEKITGVHNVFKIGNSFNYYIQKYRTHLFGNHAFYSKLITHKIIKKIKDIDPDVIHIHNLHGNYIDVDQLFRFIRCNKIPVVLTMHDCWAITGHCAHFSKVGCQKWETGCYKCPLLHDYPRTICDRSRSAYVRKKGLFTSVDMSVVAISEWARNVIENSFLKDANIYSIYNGVDISRFKPTTQKNSLREKYNLPNKKVVLSVSIGWTKEKGVEYIDKLAKKLNDDYLYLVIGVLPNEYYSDKIINLPATKNVDQLIEYYQCADVLFNPSLQEMCGLVIIEAMACGIPAVVFDTTASPYVVGKGCDEPGGIAVELGDIDGVYNAIKTITDNIKYSENARNRVEQYFNLERNNQKYLEVYKSLCKR